MENNNNVSILVVVCIITSCGNCFDIHGGISPDPQNFLYKYAMIKLYESCFGRAAMFAMKSEVGEATRICQGELSESYLPDYITPNPPPSRPYFNRNHLMQQFVDRIPLNPAVAGKSSKTNNIQSNWQPQSNVVQRPMYYYMPLQTNNFPSYSAHLPFQFRAKRDGEKESEKLDGLKNDILTKLSNITCILSRIGILDDNKRIDVKGLKQKYSDMDEVDVLMKADLMQGVDTCAKFATCVPLEEFSATPIGRDIAPAIMFVNCFKGKKMEACIKRDLRERLLESMQQQGMPARDVEEILSRTKTASPVNSIPVPEDGQDMENFIFAMLYESEPKSLLS